MTYDFTSLLVVIIVMFLMLVVGFFCRKIGWIDDVASKRLSTLIIKVGQPMMIIDALVNVQYTNENLKKGLLILAIGFFLHFLMSLIAFPLCLSYNDLNDNYCFGTTEILVGKEGFSAIGMDENKIDTIIANNTAGLTEEDINAQIEKMAKQVLSDKDLMKLFKNNPIKAVEKILGIDLPDEIVEKIVAGVNAKIAVDGAKDALGMLKKLF